MKTVQIMVAAALVLAAATAIVIGFLKDKPELVDTGVIGLGAFACGFGLGINWSDL